MGGRDGARSHLDSTVILVLTKKIFRGRLKFVVSEASRGGQTDYPICIYKIILLNLSIKKLSIKIKIFNVLY